MEFKKVLEERHSVRKFKPEEIPKEKLLELLKLTNLAPSAGNLQAFKIFAVKSQEKRTELADACFGQSFVSKAPIVLVFCADIKKSAKLYKERGELYSVQDASIAAAYSQLAAVDLGLASVWVGSFEDEKVQKVLGTDLRPVAVIPLGFADEKPRKTARKKLEELVKEV
jgi:nitroreductase